MQLMRLVQQFSAIAGWFTYPYAVLQQRQYLKAVSPAANQSPPPLPSALEDVESEEGLDRLALNARQVQPDVWEFAHPLTAQTAFYGLKFRASPNAEWAYLVLWGDRPARLPLQAELEGLQAAIALDERQAYHKLQAEHYQQSLRRIEHQIRNPLAVIQLYASNLHASLEAEAEQLQAGAICDAVRHLSDHLTGLIAGCQRTQIRAEGCSVRAMFLEVWQGLQLAAQDRQIELVLPAQPLHILGDRAQLLQAFENLLHNALCFSPPQGKISVHWQLFQREVLITVTDQGPGLTSKDLQRMFQPYYSKRPQGSGLGLPIVRQIAQDHGGKVWADNVPDGGAQFSLVLPRQPNPSPPAPGQRGPGP